MRTERSGDSHSKEQDERAEALRPPSTSPSLPNETAQLRGCSVWKCGMEPGCEHTLRTNSLVYFGVKTGGTIRNSSHELLILSLLLE